MTAPSVLSLATDGLAFATGGLTTYFDCFQTMTIRVGRVPETFRFNPYVIGLAVLCGGVAAMACWASAMAPNGVLSTVLTLQSADPWRGVVVGASVLILIRSKLFNIANSPVGGDYLYDLGRNGVIDDANRKYTIVRSQFQNQNQSVSLQAGQQFESNITSLITTIVGARPASVQTLFNSKVTILTGNRPMTPFDPTATEWVTYYRALIGLALDACGPTVVRQTQSGFT